MNGGRFPTTGSLRAALRLVNGCKSPSGERKTHLYSHSNVFHGILNGTLPLCSGTEWEMGVYQRCVSETDRE